MGYWSNRRRRAIGARMNGRSNGGASWNGKFVVTVGWRYCKNLVYARCWGNRWCRAVGTLMKDRSNGGASWKDRFDAGAGWRYCRNLV